jgi:hypothetical protein
MTITPQTVAEFEAWLTAGLIPSYKMGGNIQAAYQTYVEAYVGGVSGVQRARRTATPSEEKNPPATPTKMPSSEINTTVRRRGRPPKSAGSAGSQVSNASNLSELVLAAVSPAGTSRQTLIANPTLKGKRANHIGIAITRHIKAGRLAERDGILYNTTGTISIAA